MTLSSRNRSEKNLCRACKHELKTDDNFCTQCGAKRNTKKSQMGFLGTPKDVKEACKIAAFFGIVTYKGTHW